MHLLLNHNWLWYVVVKEATCEAWGCDVRSLRSHTREKSCGLWLMGHATMGAGLGLSQVKDFFFFGYFFVCMICKLTYGSFKPTASYTCGSQSDSSGTLQFSVAFLTNNSQNCQRKSKSFYYYKWFRVKCTRGKLTFELVPFRSTNS